MNEDRNHTLTGRVALVTGGSRGIGRATCLALAARGAAVVVHYNSSHDTAIDVVSTINNNGGSAAAVKANFLKDGAAQELVSIATSVLGQPDILVNNAAEMTDYPVIEMTDEVWNRSLMINLTAVFQCTRACLPAMKNQRWGRIINLSSQVAFTGSANHAHYALSKSGLLGFTYSIAKEVGKFGITANIVAPGRILTDMLLDRAEGREEEWLSQTPLGRFGQPEEVAAAIAFLASDEAAYITGATLNVNGGLVMG